MITVTSPSVRVDVVLARVVAVACGHARPDSVSMRGVPERITAGSGSGAATLHGRVDTGVTTRTSPAR